MAETEHRVVFAVQAKGPRPEDTPLIVMGVSDAAWEFMKDGMTHTFDLTQAGPPIRIVLFGGRTYGECRATIEGAVENVADRTHLDFSIKDDEPK